MKSQLSIQDELKQLSIDLPYGVKTPMRVPLGYFDEIENQIQAEIKQEKFLANLPKQIPYEVPTHYFNAFAENVKTHVALENALLFTK
jgi:hypothetical protein